MDWRGHKDVAAHKPCGAQFATQLIPDKAFGKFLWFHYDFCMFPQPFFNCLTVTWRIVASDEILRLRFLGNLKLNLWDCGGAMDVRSDVSQGQPQTCWMYLVESLPLTNLGVCCAVVEASWGIVDWFYHSTIARLFFVAFFQPIGRLGQSLSSSVGRSRQAKISSWRTTSNLSVRTSSSTARWSCVQSLSAGNWKAERETN